MIIRQFLGQTPRQTPRQKLGQEPGQKPGQTPRQRLGQKPGQTPGQKLGHRRFTGLVVAAHVALDLLARALPGRADDRARPVVQPLGQAQARNPHIRLLTQSKVTPAGPAFASIARKTYLKTHGAPRVQVDFGQQATAQGAERQAKIVNLWSPSMANQKSKVLWRGKGDKVIFMAEVEYNGPGDPPFQTVIHSNIPDVANPWAWTGDYQMKHVGRNGNRHLMKARGPVVVMLSNDSGHATVEGSYALTPGMAARIRPDKRYMAYNALADDPNRPLWSEPRTGAQIQAQRIEALHYDEATRQLQRGIRPYEVQYIDVHEMRLVNGRWESVPYDTRQPAPAAAAIDPKAAQ